MLSLLKPVHAGMIMLYSALGSTNLELQRIKPVAQSPWPRYVLYLGYSPTVSASQSVCATIFLYPSPCLHRFSSTLPWETNREVVYQEITLDSSTIPTSPTSRTVGHRTQFTFLTLPIDFHSASKFISYLNKRTSTHLHTSKLQCHFISAILVVLHD